MAFIASTVDIKKAFKNIHPYCNGGWVTGPQERGHRDTFIELGCVTAIKGTVSSETNYL